MCSPHLLLIAVACLSALCSHPSVAYVLVVPNPPSDAVYSVNHTLIPDSEGNFRAVANAELFNLKESNLKPADNGSDVAPTRRCFFNCFRDRMLKLTRNEVLFELYTLDNARHKQMLKIGDGEGLAKSHFDPSRPTRIAIHGWQDGNPIFKLSNAESFSSSFQNAYFNQAESDINLITVNWQAGSQTYDYVLAARRVKLVGAWVAQFIDFLVTSGGMNLNDLVVIGHSLGAHVSGFAGKHLTVGKLPLIIALDPALPMFDIDDFDSRISKNDAKKIVTIHTNAGVFGIARPVGHVNFYPNGGATQPGCGKTAASGCSHSRAVQLYTESIHSKHGFYGFKCGSYEEMMEGTCDVQGPSVRMNETAAPGVYLVMTESEAPFSPGIY